MMVGRGASPMAFGNIYPSLTIGHDGAIMGEYEAGGGCYILNNLYYDNTNWRYNSGSQGSFLSQYQGYFAFYVAPSGTAGNTVTPTEVLRILNNGNVGIGNTSAPNLLSVGSSSQFQVDSSGNITLAAGVNINIDNGTGTKIGANNVQKIGFWNATPIVQPTTSIPALAYGPVGGVPVSSNDTFGGYSLGQVVAALHNLGILA